MSRLLLADGTSLLLLADGASALLLAETVVDMGADPTPYLRRYALNGSSTHRLDARTRNRST